MKNGIYLDYNASAPLRPGVMESITRALEIPGNASSVHAFGREARRIIEHARINIAQLVGGNPENVTFNSGATEGNNSVMRAYQGQGILVSSIEHPCIIDLQHDPEPIHVTKDGVIDLNHFEELLSKNPPASLISVMMVNNETGVIQPIGPMIEMCHGRGIKFHTDASQAAGRIPLNLFMLNADYMTISSHKLGGPQGVGALITTNDTQPPVLLTGGGQERKHRAGTENTAGIAGFSTAAAHARQHLEDFQKLEEFQKYLEKNIKKIHEDIVIFGEKSVRVCNTTCCAIPKASAETLLIAMDLENIAIGSGSACSSGKVTKSHVLKAMHADEDLLSGVLRISYGWATTREEIDKFLNVFETIVKRVMR